MNGQMMNDKNYRESLKNTPGPESVVYEPAAVDYQELVSYAREKGILPCDLSEREKKSFIIL